MYFHDLLRAVADVPGDIVECGVADGRSLAVISSLARALGEANARHVWGFDAWEGLPPPVEADLAADTSIAVPGMFDFTSVGRVLEEIEAHGWTSAEIRERISLVSGYFETTLPSFDREIAFLRIDVDLYQSYLDCLSNLWPRVRRGGIVAFDEYEDVEKWPGARRAVDEFLGSLPDGAATLHEDVRAGKWWAQKVA